MTSPPVTISINWCPVCGRDDRHRPFTGRSHFSGGDRCKGHPRRVVYEHPYIVPLSLSSADVASQPERNQCAP